MSQDLIAKGAHKEYGITGKVGKVVKPSLPVSIKVVHKNMRKRGFGDERMYQVAPYTGLGTHV